MSSADTSPNDNDSSPKHVSFSGKSKLEFDSQTGDLIMDRKFDHSRALIARVAAEFGHHAIGPGSPIKNDTAVVVQSGQIRLVHDPSEDLVRLVHVDVAKDILSEYNTSTRYRYRDQLLAQITAHIHAEGTSSSAAAPRGPVTTYTTSNGLHRLAFDCTSGQMKHAALHPEIARVGRSNGQVTALPHKLQPEIDALLHSLKPPTEPSPSKKAFKFKFRSAVRAVVAIQRTKKKHETISGYVCVPRAGEPFTEEKWNSMRQYFAVLRRRKLMVFNSEAEYDQSKGVSGTRASHLLPGCQCRVADGTERVGAGRVFEVKVAPGGGWITFWAADAVTCMQWLAALSEASQQTPTQTSTQTHADADVSTEPNTLSDTPENSLRALSLV